MGKKSDFSLSELVGTAALALGGLAAYSIKKSIYSLKYFEDLYKESDVYKFSPAKYDYGGTLMTNAIDSILGFGSMITEDPNYGNRMAMGVIKNNGDLENWRITRQKELKKEKRTELFNFIAYLEHEINQKVDIYKDSQMPFLTEELDNLQLEYEEMKSQLAIDVEEYREKKMTEYEEMKSQLAVDVEEYREKKMTEYEEMKSQLAVDVEEYREKKMTEYEEMKSQLAIDVEEYREKKMTEYEEVKELINTYITEDSVLCFSYSEKQELESMDIDVEDIHNCLKQNFVENYQYATSRDISNYQKKREDEIKKIYDDISDYQKKREDEIKKIYDDISNYQEKREDEIKKMYDDISNYQEEREDEIKKMYHEKVQIANDEYQKRIENFLDSEKEKYKKVVECYIKLIDAHFNIIIKYIDNTVQSQKQIYEPLEE